VGTIALRFLKTFRYTDFPWLPV